MQGIQDSRGHGVHVIQHLIVPEAKHTVALRMQKLAAICIRFFLLQMFTAIKLNDQVMTGSTEIGNVGPYGVLSSKSHGPEPAFAQVCPKFGFGRCSLLPESAGVFVSERRSPSARHEFILHPA